jgi:hypothetical protein
MQKKKNVVHKGLPNLVKLCLVQLSDCEALEVLQPHICSGTSHLGEGGLPVRREGVRVST